MKVIQPNCRVQFTAADIEFIVANLGRKTGDADCVTKLLSDPDTRDAILDEESLFHALLENRGCLIVGGWGGGVVGLSSIDSEDASQNETTSFMNFAAGKWFHIRVRVEPEKIQAWIDEDRVVNVETTGKRIGIRLEMESSTPLGVATWNTAAAWKNIQIKKL